MYFNHPHLKQGSLFAIWYACWTGLTEGEIQSNSLLFLLAGYDTTAVAMSFLLFNLAANPHCLRKVQEEIDKKIGEVGLISFLIAE